MSLLIIGNGFDLAHEMKTRYSDFLLRFLRDTIFEFNHNMPQNKKLIHITGNSEIFRNRDIENVIDIYRRMERHSEINIETGPIMKVLIDRMKYIENWVDVETIFFDQLVLAKDGKNNGTTVRMINEELNNIRDELIKYLEKQEVGDISEDDIEHYTTLFSEPYQLNMSELEYPEYLYFLDFNYTNTIEPYLNRCRKHGHHVVRNYIHGDLEGLFGNPVFGFGDEMDRRYSSFEEHMDNALFEHMKTFRYLRTKWYRHLIQAIDNDPFDVYIFGHSCGLSDRTLLNTIFEHDNCKRIKLFYYQNDKGENDFVAKTYDMYRHFKDKSLIRNRLISLEESQAMPQVCFM